VARQDDPDVVKPEHATEIEFLRALREGDLREVAELERRVVEADGGRLKLEWGMLRSRAGQDVQDLLWREGERVVGFLGLYGFGSETVELSGMVDPPARRRGIATALLDAALAICVKRGYRRALLVVPRGSDGGHVLAGRRGAVLEHSEHALRLSDDPTEGPTDPRITLRPAATPDVPELTRLLTAAFGEPHRGLLTQVEDSSDRTLVVELEGSAVGTVRVTRDQDRAGVYGFAIDPAWQRRGIGRDVLRRVSHQARAEGARYVDLEVEVDNDHALGLYTSLGFTPLTTEDYYELPLAR
jgi:ribosomal protein S18 acetylase RimI-like enzyme